MTPYELSLSIKSYNERIKNEQEQQITTAYLTAYWQRVKKLEPLEKILGRNEAQANKKEMSDMEMLNVIKQLNATFGGEVIGE